MELWWGSLSDALRWFYAIAITTSVVMVFQLLLMIFGMDGDVDDGDVGGEAGGDVQVLSVRTVTAFFAGFGWTGVASLQAGNSLLTTLLLAVLVGGLFMGGVIGLMRALFAMRHSGTLDYRNAVGEVGTVYLRIPAAMESPGQVEVVVQGRLRVVQAFTRHGESIPNQTRVRVIETLGQNTLVVEPLAAEATQPDEPQTEEE